MLHTVQLTWDYSHFSAILLNTCETTPNIIHLTQIHYSSTQTSLSIQTVRPSPSDLIPYRVSKHSHLNSSSSAIWTYPHTTLWRKTPKNLHLGSHPCVFNYTNLKYVQYRDVLSVIFQTLHNMVHLHLKSDYLRFPNEPLRLIDIFHLKPLIPLCWKYTIQISY